VVAALYAASWLSAEWFYGSLGVTPEEVGLGTVDLLVISGVMAALLLPAELVNAPCVHRLGNADGVTVFYAAGRVFRLPAQSVLTTACEPTWSTKPARPNRIRRNRSRRNRSR
jgi:hypothetical protein